MMSLTVTNSLPPYSEPIYMGVTANDTVYTLYGTPEDDNELYVFGVLDDVDDSNYVLRDF